MCRVLASRHGVSAFLRNPGPYCRQSVPFFVGWVERRPPGASSCLLVGVALRCVAPPTLQGCNPLERCRADGIVPLRLERSRSDRRLHPLDLREDVRELLLVKLELVVDPLPFPGEVGIRPESAHAPLDQLGLESGPIQPLLFGVHVHGIASRTGCPKSDHAIALWRRNSMALVRNSLVRASETPNDCAITFSGTSSTIDFQTIVRVRVSRPRSNCLSSSRSTGCSAGAAICSAIGTPYWSRV